MHTKLLITGAALCCLFTLFLWAIWERREISTTVSYDQSEDGAWLTHTTLNDVSWQCDYRTKLPFLPVYDSYRKSNPISISKIDVPFVYLIDELKERLPNHQYNSIGITDYRKVTSDYARQLLHESHLDETGPKFGYHLGIIAYGPAATGDNRPMQTFLFAFSEDKKLIKATHFFHNNKANGKEGIYEDITNFYASRIWK